MNAFFWLILAALPGAPIEARYPEAVEVFRCGFEDDTDRNYDGWPDGWSREQGPGFPHFVRIEIAADRCPEGRRCLRMELNGGAAAAYGPAIAIQPSSSYVLEAYVATESLVHDEASLSITFFDADHKSLETLHSATVTGNQPWRKLRLGPVATSHNTARYAKIGLHLLPTEGKDLRGTARFDDLWLGSLPRMTLETRQPQNLFVAPGQVELVCRLSGFSEAQGRLRFELVDALGQSVDRFERSLVSGDGDPQGNAQPLGQRELTIPWRPKIDQPGFYLARVAMQSGQRVILDRQTTLAVITPRAGPPGGEFGWSLPDGGGPLELPALAQVLTQTGVSWIKFPLWFGDNEPRRVEGLVRFVERLSSEGIEIVGLLNDPPEKLRSQFGSKRQLTGADIFTPEAEVWYPALEPVMTQLSMKVRRWQLGDDDDMSFVGYPNLSGKVGQVKKQLNRIGQDMRLGFGWRWLEQEPPAAGAPWQFITLSADPPLTADELTAYLSSAPATPVERWVAIAPLERNAYSTATRAADLVERMVAAKMHGARRIFIPRPLGNERGLLNDDGTPGELLVPWMTAAANLSGATYVGSLQLPGRSENRLFARDAEAVMVVWSQTARQETLNLGENLEQWDLWGRRLSREASGSGQTSGQTIEAGPLPTFITGINLPVARCCQSLVLSPERLPSVFGTPHACSLTIKNWFPRGAGGKIRLVLPEGWQADPKEFDFKLAAGEEQQANFELRLPFDANSGVQNVRIDVQLTADRSYEFSMHRSMQVGLGDISLEAESELSPQGELIVTQRLYNHSDQPVSFRCSLFASNRRRVRTQVFDLGRGEDVQKYHLPAGRELLGQTLWIRAEEIDGPRVFSHRFKATE